MQHSPLAIQLMNSREVTDLERQGVFTIDTRSGSDEEHNRSDGVVSSSTVQRKASTEQKNYPNQGTQGG